MSSLSFVINGEPKRLMGNMKSQEYFELKSQLETLYKETRTT